MKSKKIITTCGLVMVLGLAGLPASSKTAAAFSPMTVYAAEAYPSISYADGDVWVNPSGTSWRLQRNGNFLTNCWYADKDGSWYFLKSDGYMAEKVFTDTDGSVYLLNWKHDGTYGKLLTSGTYNGVTIQTNENHDGTWGRIINTDAVESLKVAVERDESARGNGTTVGDSVGPSGNNSASSGNSNTTPKSNKFKYAGTGKPAQSADDFKVGAWTVTPEEAEWIRQGFR